MTATQLAMPINMSEQGEVRQYTISLPFTPPSKNAYDGWPNEWKRSLKAKWMKAVIAACEEQQIPIGQATKIGLAAILVFPTNAGRDTQNYANALWHFVPDALVKYGVIPNDTPEYVEWGANFGIRFRVDSRKIDKKRRQRTHIGLTLFMPKAGHGPR